MRLCIVAGSGDLPKNVINGIGNQQEISVICVDGFAEETDFANHSNVCTIKLGEVGKALTFLKRNNITHIIFAGKVKRPSLHNLNADLAGLKLLARLLKCKLLGDDQLLREVINYLEEQGFKVLGSNDILNIKLDTGSMTQIVPSQEQLDDIKVGVNVLNTLSKLDIGQAVIVSEKRVVAIEAAEGTDELMERSSKYLENEESSVLIKISKSSQDLRIDLPTIGENTIITAAKNKISGIAIEGGKVIIVDRQQTIAKANELGIFIYVTDGENYVN